MGLSDHYHIKNFENKIFYFCFYSAKKKSHTFKNDMPDFWIIFVKTSCCQNVAEKKIPQLFFAIFTTNFIKDDFDLNSEKDIHK